MKKYFFILLIFYGALFSAVNFSLAQTSETEDYKKGGIPEKITLPAETAPPPGAEETFEARVMKILDQKEIEREDGSAVVQQNLLLKGLAGEWRGKEVKFEGISDVEVADAGAYKTGDKVLVQRNVNQAGEEKYYITDFVRRGYLYLLALIFCAVIVLISRKKGFRSLIGLAVSFLIIVKFILPQILSGANPLLIALAGSFCILAIMIYLTEGWSEKSHLSVLSVLISLFFALALSWLFVKLTRLSGLAQEEAVFLIDVGEAAINFQGLLLAGMLIGAIGVLDDVIVGQMAAVRQIKEINPELNQRQVFTAAFKIGNTHLGAIVNTLFLTYAGASLPLLLLFIAGQEPFLSFGRVVNHEVIATEIVRALTGSIGVALSLPIATYLGARWLKVKKSA
ncbi:MAG: YibE/F family protein [Planctomycetes bacterium]|jgi:uncharacterized membrane protein|nr:YibE/F family protein [Planctomycetota bacterium]